PRPRSRHHDASFRGNFVDANVNFTLYLPATTQGHRGEAGMSKDKDPQDFLAPSHYFDYEHPRVRAFIEESVGDAVAPVERAVKLYYAVRDGIRYDPYRFYMRRE